MNNKVVTIPEKISGTHEEGKQNEEAPRSPKVIRRAQKPGQRSGLHPLSCHLLLQEQIDHANDLIATRALSNQSIKAMEKSSQGQQKRALIPELETLKLRRKKRSSLSTQWSRCQIVAPRSGHATRIQSPGLLPDATPSKKSYNKKFTHPIISKTTAKSWLRFE